MRDEHSGQTTSSAVFAESRNPIAVARSESFVW